MHPAGYLEDILNTIMPHTRIDIPIPIIIEPLTVQCMADNYRSFLTLNFTLNRFLNELLNLNKDKVLPDKQQQILKCILRAFPGNKIENSPLNYKLEITDRVIHLEDSIQNINPR
jgi:hypothetical protein